MAHKKSPIADLPASVSCRKVQNSAGVTYWRVRVGKKFTGGSVLEKNFASLGKAKEWIFGKIQRLKAQPGSLIELKASARAAAFLLTPVQITEAAVYPGDLIPWLSVGMFAGLRPEEAKRLEWQNIDFRRKHIDLPARRAKGRKRRIIPLEPNLIKWLSPYRPASGEGKIVQNFRWKFQAFAKAANYSPWPKDCLRHSYASYHLAKFENSGKTAEYMGHRSAQMLYDRYREVIKEPADIEMYWNLVPS